MHRARIPRGRPLVAAILLFGLLAAGCGGARSGDGTTAPPAPGATPASERFAASSLQPASSPRGDQAGGARNAGGATPAPAISTQEASQLLDQVDGDLRQLDAELAADADDTANQGE
jgi:hypothetical protein